MRVLKHACFYTILFPILAAASLPRIPFSGSLGATEGAGSIVGWERLGLGANPAVLNPGTLGVSIAGYSPFGIDDVEVTEAAASWDGAMMGTSVAYQGFYASEGGASSAWRLQESMHLGFGLTAGALALFQDDESGSGFGGGAGVLWNRFSFVTLGGLSEITPVFQGHELNTGLGADIGSGLPGGYAWRLCAENLHGSIHGTEWRFGAALKLHDLLSVNGGWSPDNQTTALGIRFGFGNWEGFSALRRHAALGTTPVQGMHWKKSTAKRRLAP